MQKIMKQYLMLQIMNWIEIYLQEKKITGWIKDELGEKIRTEFEPLRPKM